MSGWLGDAGWSGGADGAVAVAALRAQVGRIRDSVEGLAGYDPSGLRVSARDTGSGVEVQLGVGAGVATPDPGSALGWSVPLRDVTGRRIENIGPFLLEGFVRALPRVNPVNFATPSKLWFGVGVLADGPLGTATRGIVWGLQNVAASEWRTIYITMAGGVWGAVQNAVAGQANPGGVHGVWGGPNLSEGQTFGVSALPLTGASSGTSKRGFDGVVMAGSDPHLFLCAGWAGTPETPDSVTFLPFAHFLPSP